MNFEDVSLLYEIEGLAGLEDIEAAKKKAAPKKKVTAKPKAIVKAKVKPKVKLTPQQRVSVLRGKKAVKVAKTQKATGACGTYDIGCKVERGIKTAGKGLLILGAILGVAWIGKSYLEKRAMQRVVEYPAQRVAIPAGSRLLENPNIGKIGETYLIEEAPYESHRRGKNWAAKISGLDLKLPNPM